MWIMVGDKHELALAKGLMIVEVEAIGDINPIDNSQEYVISVRGYNKRTKHVNRFDNILRAKLGALQEAINMMDYLRDQLLANLDSVEADLLIEALRRQGHWDE